MAVSPALSRAFEAVSSTAGVHSCVVRVEDAQARVMLNAAHGDARAGVPMEDASRFHVASIAKTMTATLLLQLWEAGALGAKGLNTPYTAFGVLPKKLAGRLHCRSSVSKNESLTLRHLLTHTAGIRDVMEDDADQLGGPAPRSVIGSMIALGGDPSRRWEPWVKDRHDDPDAGVINRYFAGRLGEAALWTPGWAFHYSDTGYMLLALLIEKLTKRAYGDLLHEQIFGPLGMTQTYLAYRNDPDDLEPGREPESDVWMGSLPVLSSGASLSFDWGGGGVVSTAPDLVSFLRALLAGELFKSEKIVKAMTTWRAPRKLNAPRVGVGLGLFKLHHNGVTLIGHSGASGAKMFYAPDLEVFITGTVNQMRGAALWPFDIAQALLMNTRKGKSNE